MNTTSQLNNYSHTEIVAAFTKYVTNQRNCDKSALQYFIGMIAGHKYPQALFGCYTRAEVTTLLLHLVNDGSNVYKCIKSDYTEKQLLKYLTPKETPMKYTSLSPYTIADNCMDESDLSYGLAELQAFVRNRKGSSALAYKRMNAIMKKLKSLK